MEDIKKVHEKEMEAKHQESKRINPTGIEYMLRS